MNKGLLIVIILVILVGTGVFLFSKRAGTRIIDTVTNNPEQKSEEECSSPAANVVLYCGGKFSSLTVSAGTTVTFKNDTARSVEIASDPHPEHTDNTELNIGILKAGESKTVTLTKKGTWGIHNHQNSSEFGTIIVQ